jgi:hypothetical protein
MQAVNSKWKQMIILGILILLVTSFSLCTGDDDKKDDNGDNGDNGGNGGNQNNTTKDPITNITTRQDPEMGSVGSSVRIFVTFDSKNPIPEDDVGFQLCVGEICFEVDPMQYDTLADEYFYDFSFDDGHEGKDLKYKIWVTDSLDNQVITDYIKLNFN